VIPAGDIHVAPSLLSADFGNLAAAVELVAPETSWLHVDVMDGHFVPNLTIGPPVVASLRRHSSLFFDCHLMMTNPEKYLEAFQHAGADLCSVHVEIGNTGALITQMRDLGLSVGIVLNPDTPFSVAEPFLDRIDLLLVMSVYPGFGGQSFIEDVLEKVEEARGTIDSQGLDVKLEIDGGIDAKTAPRAAKAGARVFVAGNAVFGQPDPRAAVVTLRESIAMALAHG
jgi:ribulose-phosphate 3-epimerase